MALKFSFLHHDRFYNNDVIDEEFIYSETGIYKQISPENEHAVSDIVMINHDYLFHKSF